MHMVWQRVGKGRVGDKANVWVQESVLVDARR